jgi:hypothetical protein
VCANGRLPKESIIRKYENGVLRWFGRVERMGDERIAKQVLNGSVEGVRDMVDRKTHGWV